MIPRAKKNPHLRRSRSLLTRSRDYDPEQRRLINAAHPKSREVAFSECGPQPTHRIPGHILIIPRIGSYTVNFPVSESYADCPRITFGVSVVEQVRGETTLRRFVRASDGVNEKPLRRAEQDLAATLLQDALTLPLAQQATHVKEINVGRVRQLFIGDVQNEAIGNPLPNSLRKTRQNMGKFLPSRVAR